MKPVTWSQASVSANDLSLAPSVMFVFPAQAIWMSTISWAAAKVSEFWLHTNVCVHRSGKSVLLFAFCFGNPSERLRHRVETLSEKWETKKH